MSYAVQSQSLLIFLVFVNALIWCVINQSNNWCETNLNVCSREYKAEIQMQINTMKYNENAPIEMVGENLDN